MYVCIHFATSHTKPEVARARSNKMRKLGGIPGTRQDLISRNCKDVFAC